MFLTAQLVFTIFMLATEKHEGTFIAPIGIGLSLFVAELMGVYYTGGSVNPARSFGPSVVSHKFESYHWIYWVGPILGALLASAFYMFVKACKYNTLSSTEVTLANDVWTVEYETVNLETNDPKKAVAAKIENKLHNKRGQNADGTEKRDVIETGPRAGTGYEHHDRTASGISGDTFDGASTLENGGSNYPLPRWDYHCRNFILYIISFRNTSRYLPHVYLII
jgi:aquaporin related protein